MKVNSSIIKALWLLVIVLLVMGGRAMPMPLLIALLLIVFFAPIIREFRPQTDLDERQLQISHLSSHISFYVFIALTVLVMLKDYIGKGQNPPPYLYMLLLIPLLVKLLISVYQNYDPRRVAFWIGYGWLGVWALFIVLSHGISPEALIELTPFLAVIVLAVLFRKKILISGVLFIVFAIGLSLFFRGWLRLDLYVRLLMYALVPLPLLISGIVLIWNYAEGRKTK
ncbi:MAG: hypothetical protein GXO77_02200 [Calditrichaeota bacterium]|nr:hypothetical protein [Calditrichota bacterium]